ncbi:hypothetical protein ACFYRN_24910 [Streptomyces sp. NPDC005227]
MEQAKDQRPRAVIAKHPTVLFGKYYWWLRGRDGKLSLIPCPTR